ncbi:MAG TPA: pyridoxamine 5'-phosphate oxidase family protein [Thermopolyspora sp.]
MSEHAGSPDEAQRRISELDADECLRLISSQEVGRVAFNTPEGPMILPVNYKLYEGAIVFRTAAGGPMDKDLRTRLEGVEFKIAFEVDRFDETAEEGWSVLVHGGAHHVPSDEVATVAGALVTPWAGGVRELYLRIVPQHITGRRIHHG